jgi:hypothetical protein
VDLLPDAFWRLLKLNPDVLGRPSLAVQIAKRIEFCARPTHALPPVTVTLSVSREPLGSGAFSLRSLMIWR